MNKTSSIILIVALIIAGAIVLSGNKDSAVSNEPVQNSEIKDGIQYISIDAKGGYLPRKSIAKAGIPTRLIVKTQGTYDCSASLVIKSIKYQKILDQNAEEVIDIGIPVAGEPLQGLCGMGMYNFEIDFI